MSYLHIGVAEWVERFVYTFQILK